MLIPEIALLTSEAEVLPLVDEWRALQTAYGNSAFTAPDLFLAWLRTYAKEEGWTLQLLALRKNGKLLGLLPLATHRVAKFRVLCGYGACLSFPCDALADAPETADILWQAAKEKCAYDFAWIAEVLDSSHSGKSLQRLGARRRGITFYSLDLSWPTGKAWFDSMPGKWRGKALRRFKHLEKEGPVSFDSYYKTEIPRDVLHTLLAQKKAWSVTHAPGSFYLSPACLPFFESIVETGGPQGTVLLSVLLCGSNPISWSLRLCHGQTLHGIVITHDPAWARFSPGTQMHIHSIQWAIDNGFKTYDFMSHGNLQKEELSNNVSGAADYSFAPNFKGRILASLYALYRRKKDGR
jgi:CelD/BcsL family acetyltransferase involved in cellulose biosynthesis